MGGTRNPYGHTEKTYTGRVITIWPARQPGPAGPESQAKDVPCEDTTDKAK